MGLDMYLTANKYVRRYNYDAGNEIQTGDFSAIAGLVPTEVTKHGGWSGIEVSYPIAYWRKANAIHGWFVKNVGYGIDECQKMHVGHNQLRLLRDTCESVMKDSSLNLAWELLPPMPGFFFGSYEIDEWYMRDLEQTVKMLSDILTVIPEDDWRWSITYQASW
jgi:hypothetical protein